MRIKYVGNAGVIIETQETCVGIDCFCKDEFGIYPDLSREDGEQLFRMIGQGTLTSLIFTHEHSDHFCAEDVKDACKKNPSLTVWAGRNVIGVLYKDGIPCEQLKMIEPPKRIAEKNLSATFIKTQHDGEHFADVENLTVLLDAEGKKVVVTGDAKPAEALFEQIAAWSKDVDLLVVPFPYVGLKSARRHMEEYLCVRSIVATHEPRPEKDQFGWLKSAEKLCEQAKDGLPSPIFAKKQREWQCL